MGLGRDHPGLEHGRTHRPRRGFLPDQGGCRIGEHWNALGFYDHLPRGHRATADPAWRPAHLPDAPRPLDTPSWHRVLRLLSKLPTVAWERFLVWMALGLLLYFSYGRRHSVLAKRGRVPFEGRGHGSNPF